MKLNKKILIIFVVSLILVAFLTFLGSMLTGTLKGTTTIEYGILEIDSSVKCYIVRDETVYTAGSSGTVTYEVEEGTQVRVGTSILKIKKQKSESDKKSQFSELLEDLKGDTVKSRDNESQRKGVVSYYLDGYEGKFSPDNLSEITLSDVNDISSDPMDIQTSKVKKGDPIFKICDNSKWYILFWIEEGEISKYRQDDRVTAQLTNGEVEGTVSEIVKQDDQWLIILQTNGFYENFAQERVVDGTIKTIGSRGLIIDNRAITTRDKKVGVFVKQTSGDYEFVPVEVILSDGEQSLVTEEVYFDKEGNPVDTVNVYDEILTHPKSER